MRGYRHILETHISFPICTLNSDFPLNFNNYFISILNILKKLNNMNKISFCIVLALVLLLACAVSAQQQEKSSNSVSLLRDIIRRMYPNASDSQIVKKLFPSVRKLKKKASDKLLNLISSLSDSQGSDCSKYCAGSTGDYKISCLQHCHRNNL